MSVIDAQSSSADPAPDHPLVAAGAQLMAMISRHIETRAAAPEPVAGEERARRAARRLRDLKQTCRALAEQNELVASAVGACGCWGSDVDCPSCGGRGCPGALPVDPAAFAAIVAPLVALRPDLFAQQGSAPPRESKRQTT
jgi:hypothetical protein